MFSNNISHAIHGGISFLRASQRQNGGFLGFSSHKPHNFKKGKVYHSTFHTSLILSSLANIEQSKAIKKMEARIASFLLNQKSKCWTFNYWERNSEESKLLPYPDDLDDTFCALAALTRYNPRLIGATAMAYIVRLLTTLEQKPGGPYRTWLVSRDASEEWQGIDLAVNSNIAYFLSLHNISLPNLQLFMEHAIASQSYTSSYYPSVYPLLYFITRAYQGKKNAALQSFLIKKRELPRDNSLRNPLYTALLVNSFFNLNIAPDTLDHHIKYLLRMQNKDGSWRASAFCIDPAMRGKVYYSGSPSLTTAYCVEAISKYHARTSRSEKKGVTTNTNHRTEEIKHITKTVISRAKQQYAHFDKDLKHQCLTTLASIIKRDKDSQIVCMPYFFTLALKPQYRVIPSEYIVSLGAANLYGWIAYTIYDDFLDNEGAPKLLPVANVCFRELILMYEKIFQSSESWKRLFHDVIDTIEMSNAWEVSHCRITKKKNALPNYGNLSRLAERSLGHALGPLAILSRLGYDTSSQEVKNLKEFFIHFLIARQLYDDTHDWEQDLKKGHVNSVGALLLRRYRKSDFQEHGATLQKLFWYEIIVAVIRAINVHLAQAKQTLKKISIIDEKFLIEKLIEPIENSAKNTLKERKNTMEFLKSIAHLDTRAK